MSTSRNILVLALLACCACSKPAMEPRKQTLEVSVPADTKVHINGLKTCWDAGDAVTVFYKSPTPESWTFLGETGEVSGQIGCSGLAGRNETRGDIFVLYPQDTDAVLEGNTIYTEIPSIQQYRKNSYGTTLLASRSTFDILHLYYCTAMMELQYRGPAEISHITLRGNAGERICGESSISFHSSKPVLSCSDGTSVTLDCNVSVKDTATESFLFSIAPCTFNDGVTFTVHFKDGTEHTVSASEKMSVEAGHICSVGAGSPELPYTQKVMQLLFSDGTTRNNPFTEDIKFKCGTEIGPYYYSNGKEQYPFHMLCQTAIASGTTSQHNFRITNGGGLYIGGTKGDYITFPAVAGYRLQDIAVSLNKDSDFHIVPANDASGQAVPGGVCSGSQGGDFRMLSLSGTKAGTSYRMYVDNICCFRSITLYYRK